MPVPIDNQYTENIAVVGPTVAVGDDVYAQKDPPNNAAWTTDAITAAPVLMSSGTQATGKFLFTAAEMDVTESYTLYRNVHLAAVESYDGSTLLTITGHGITDESLVYVQGANIPSNLVAGKQYYLVAGDSDTFELSATAGGVALSVGSVSGTLVMYVVAASKRTPSDDLLTGISPDSTENTLAAILADTNELQADVTDGGRTDALIDSIIAQLALVKARTDLIGTSAAQLEDISSEVIVAIVGSTESKTVACSTDISGKTLSIIFETLTDGTDIATVADGSITKDTTTVSFNLPSATTTVERTLRFAVRDTGTLEDYATGLLFVTYDAEGD